MLASRSSLVCKENNNDGITGILDNRCLLQIIERKAHLLRGDEVSPQGCDGVVLLPVRLLKAAYAFAEILCTLQRHAASH